MPPPHTVDLAWVHPYVPPGSGHTARGKVKRPRLFCKLFFDEKRW